VTIHAMRREYLALWVGDQAMEGGLVSDCNFKDPSKFHSNILLLGERLRV